MEQQKHQQNSAGDQAMEPKQFQQQENPSGSTLKVKMTKMESQSTPTGGEQTRQNFNQQTQRAGQTCLPGAMGPPPIQTAIPTSGEAPKKAKRKTIVQKIPSMGRSGGASSEKPQRSASSESRVSGNKDAAGKLGGSSLSKPNSSPGNKQPTHKKRSNSSSHQAGSMPAASQSSPPKLGAQLHASQRLLVSEGAKSYDQKLIEAQSLMGVSTFQAEQQQISMPAKKITTVITTRKIKVASSTKKKMGASSSSTTYQQQDKQGGGKITRTTIIKKVIRKKKSSLKNSMGSETSQKVVKSSSIKSKQVRQSESGKSQQQLKLKSLKSHDSSVTSKPQRPPILLTEEEEQFRWILKPFATVDDQKTWRERFTNLLVQREQAYSDPDKKEPPCMACYTKIPSSSIAKEVQSLAEQEDIIFPNRLTPKDITWLTIKAFCKRCCSNKQQLTGAHLSCLGMRNRGFQLLDLTMPPQQATNQVRDQLEQATQKRILLFECDLCAFSRSKKNEPGSEQAVKKFATCLVCRRRNWSSKENPGSLMKKVVEAVDFVAGAGSAVSGEAIGENATSLQQQQQAQPAVAGVHAICAALLGKQRGIKLIDAKQMLYSYTPPSALGASEGMIQPEESKESLPKCDICKVTIKRAGTITVKCSGFEEEDFMDCSDDSGDKMQKQSHDRNQTKRNTIECQKRVHSSCLMERSKWKAYTSGQQIYGFCRTHDSHFKERVNQNKSFTIFSKLLKVDRDVLLAKQTISSTSQQPSSLIDQNIDTEMAVSVDGSHFKLNVEELLFEQTKSVSPQQTPIEFLDQSPNTLIKMKSQGKDSQNEPGAVMRILSVFEQYLVAKLWFSQARQAIRLPTSDQLIRSHITQANMHLLFDFGDVTNQLTLKLNGEAVFEPEDQIQITALLEQANPQEIYEQNKEGEKVLNQEIKERNQSVHSQIIQHLTKCYQQQNTLLLKGQLLELYVRGNQHYVLSRAEAMIQAPDKSLLFEEVKEVLQFLLELNLTNYIVFEKLSKLCQTQKTWREKIDKLLSISVPHEDGLTADMRSYRNRQKGIALMQTRMYEFKRLFAEKPPCEDMIALLNLDLMQTVFDNSRYIQRLQQKYLWVTQYDDLPQTLQQIQCQPKPVKNLFQTLILLACQPIRALSVDTLLKIWQHSCLWQAHAKSFIVLHHLSNQQTSRSRISSNVEQVDWDSSHEPMDIDEAIECDNHFLSDLKDLEEQNMPRVTSQLSRHIEQVATKMQEEEAQSLAAAVAYENNISALVDGTTNNNNLVIASSITQQKSPTRMFFTESDIDELLSQQPCEDLADFNQVHFVYDKCLCEKVWNRADYLRKLKAKLEHVALECHQIDEIAAYIKECKAQTNFDLSHEAEVAKEKLCLMQDSMKIGEVNNQEDQGLVASEVHQRVQKLKEREEDKIRIPSDLEMMLQAKVQISEKLRRDFYDILEKGKGADSFNKEEMQNLRNIVQKATKEHGLQMEQETKIVDNLRSSEAWFVQTFQSIQASCGHYYLNQIDFKDFQQLHSIFQSSKDCEALLKKHVHSKSQMENLGGAAKNLYISLLRSKWLFDVKNLMDKSTGTKDLAQLLCLYNRAIELQIDFNETAQQSSVYDPKNEYILMDGVADHQQPQLPTQPQSISQISQENILLKEFSRFGKVSREFDALFGSHLKIIQTLEKHEKEEKMEDLKLIVQRLQIDLQLSPLQSSNSSSGDLALQQKQQSATSVVGGDFPLSNLIKRETANSQKVFAISTANELEILNKVRDYIRLNENYMEFMLRTENSDIKNAMSLSEPTKDEQLKNETEVAQVPQQQKQVAETLEKNEGQEELKKAQIVTTQINTMEEAEVVPSPEKPQQVKGGLKQKISYQKAMELQRQAREQQIPDDIPVLKRLNQSVLRFEKFRRLCTDYYRFRDKIKQKGAELLTSNSALIGPKSQERPKLLTQQSSSGLQQTNSDTKFNLHFLKRLLVESDEIEIEIPKEYFNKEKIIEELTLFQQWKIKTEQTLKQLEKELSHSATIKPENLTDVISEGTRKQFEEAKQRIRDLPVFDTDTFMRIQAFEWLLMATSLIQGQQCRTGGGGAAIQAPSSGEKPMTQSQRIYSLTFWEQLFRQHENYLKVLPMLEDHPIIQNILWEMDRAKHIVEFVKATKKKIQSNQGKFLSDRYYNYVAFKDKQDPIKIRKLLEQAQNTRVDINEETQALKEWLRNYERYTQMDENGTLYSANNYDKIKQIYKNIYLSPLDFGDLYFEIGKRLEIANQIKSDIKLITEENQFENSKVQRDNKKRISLSRIQTDLNHFRMNCQIPGIFEIDRVMTQIKASRKTIQECKDILMSEENFPTNNYQKQIESLEMARKIQCLIEIDMEDEEFEIRKLMFQKNFDLTIEEHIKIDVEQFIAMQNEFKQVLRNELDSDIVESFKEFMGQANMCLMILKKCPTKELLEKEVKEKVDEICPQINFDQLFIDRAAELFHQSQQKGPFDGVEDSNDEEEGEAEMSEDNEASQSANSQISKAGKDSKNVSVGSESDSSSSSGNSQSGDSSSSSSSGDEGKSSESDNSSNSRNIASKQKKDKQEQSPNGKEESKIQKNPKNTVEQRDGAQESQEDAEMQEGGESEQEEEQEGNKLQNASATKKKKKTVTESNKDEGNDEHASDEDCASGEESSSSSQQAIATRKPKRNVKSNKMDAYIYYPQKSAGQQRTSEEAGLSKNEIKSLPTKRKKTSEQPSSDSEKVFSDSPLNEQEEAASREEKKKQEELSRKRRQQKRERKEAKQAEKSFMKQKQRQMEIRERRKMVEMTPIDSEMAFNITQDQELQSRLKQTQDRIRNRSKTQIYDVLAKYEKKLFALNDPVSQVEEKENEDEDQDREEIQYKLHLKSVMQQLETIAFEKNNQVTNNQYQNKISDIVQNLMLLQTNEKYRELAELFFVRKTFQIQRFYASCPNFTEFVEKIYRQRMERRRRLNKERGIPQQQSVDVAPARGAAQVPQQQDISIPRHQKLLPLAYPGNPERISTQQDLAKHAFPSLAKQEIIVQAEIVDESPKAGTSEEVEEEQKISAATSGEKVGGLTRHDSLASIDSLESNPAKFSDDEDFDPYKSAASGLQRASKSRDGQSSKYRQQIQQQRSESVRIIPMPCIVQIQQFKYNPYSIVQLSKQMKSIPASLRKQQQKLGGDLLGMSGMMMPLMGPSKPDQILYNPMIKGIDGKAQEKSNIQSLNGSSSIKTRNVATPGSLLKVWEGSLDLSGGGSTTSISKINDQMVECQLFSVGDIRQYQALPEFPTKLILKGKSKIAEVTTHFKKLRQEMQSQKHHGSNNVLLKGWVTRKNISSQDNSDKYTMHYDTLELAQRCSVFTLFEGVSVYFIPITSQTKDFCRQMGIYPLKGKDGAVIGGKNANNPEENSILDETHYFAFLSQIRQSFTKRSSYQNPEVICHGHDMPKIHQLQPTRPIQSAHHHQQQQPPLKNELTTTMNHPTSQDVTQAINKAALQSATNVSDPRFHQQDIRSSANQVGLNNPSPNQVQHQQIIMKSEVTPGQGYGGIGPGVPQQDNNMIVIDEDEARIDALIEKFRAQEDPNIDEIQRELPPLISGNSEQAGRMEEKLVAFLKEIIDKVQSKQQQKTAAVNVASTNGPPSQGYGNNRAMHQHQLDHNSQHGNRDVLNDSMMQQQHQQHYQHQGSMVHPQQQMHHGNYPPSQQDIQQQHMGGYDGNSSAGMMYGNGMPPGSNNSAGGSSAYNAAPQQQPQHQHLMQNRGMPPPQQVGTHYLGGPPEFAPYMRFPQQQQPATTPSSVPHANEFNNLGHQQHPQGPYQQQQQVPPTQPPQQPYHHNNRGQ